jgi:urease accessory protein
MAGIVLMASGRRRPGAGVLGAGFALAGLLHGLAFAEAAVGAEPGPLLAYLLGLGLMQAGLAGGAFALARLLARRPGRLRALRHATGFGAVAIAVGGLAQLAM